MRGYFGVGIEQSSKPMNAGNLFRTAHAFGASFLFTVNSRIFQSPRQNLILLQHHGTFPGMISILLKI